MSDRRSERDDPRLALGQNGMNQGGQWRVMVMIMRERARIITGRRGLFYHTGAEGHTFSLFTVCNKVFAFHVK